MGGEGSRSQKNKSNKGFVVREVPIQRMKINNDAEWSKGKSFAEMEKAMMMDYDAPELVVFLQEDRGASAKDECVMEDCESYEEAAETTCSSSVSKGSDSPCRNPRIVKHSTNKCGFGNHPTEGSEEEEEDARLFNNKHGEWCSCGTGVSASHESSDSISSTHSFTFPILQREWSGSPVRMAEAGTTSRSTRRPWRRIFCSFCKC